MECERCMGDSEQGRRGQLALNRRCLNVYTLETLRHYEKVTPFGRWRVRIGHYFDERQTGEGSEIGGCCCLLQATKGELPNNIKHQ